MEAYVGLDSFRHLAKERALMAGLASSLKVPSEEVPARVATLVERGAVATAALYVFVSVAGAIGALFAGLMLARGLFGSAVA